MSDMAIWVAMLQAKARRDNEQSFEKLISSMPADQQAQLRKDRAEARAKAEQEASVERRHRELCNAIRYSRPTFQRLY